MNALFLCLVVLLACVSLALTGFGVVLGAAAARRRPPRPVGGPYRTSTLSEMPGAPGTSHVALGSAAMSLALAPAIVHALLVLRWEGIGVSLLPALALSAARLWSAAIAPRDFAPLRTIATAALLLDVPLLGFALLHMSGDAHMHELSLAAVAARFAFVDGIQSLLVVAYARSGHERD